MLAYVSAKKQIIQFIKNKSFRAGDRLPTEVELSEQLDISRLTLREALNALKNEGLIHAVQGRGTFLACDFTQIADSLNINTSVSEMIEAAGYRPGVASFKKELVKADAVVAERLQVTEGTDVLMCARIRLADDEPVTSLHGSPRPSWGSRTRTSLFILSLKTTAASVWAYASLSWSPWSPIQRFLKC